MQHGHADQAAVRVLGQEADGGVDVGIAHLMATRDERRRHTARALAAVNLHIDAGLAEIAALPCHEREGVGRLEGPVQRQPEAGTGLSAQHARRGEGRETGGEEKGAARCHDGFLNGGFRPS